MRTQWNTGCKYTKEGQVIVAEINPDSGTVLFKDFSRGISGELTTEFMSEITEKRLQDFTHTEYLHNRYKWNGQADKLKRND